MATVAGDIREAGLPNIEGSGVLSAFENSSASITNALTTDMGATGGAFSNYSSAGARSWYVPDGKISASKPYGLSFDASRSSDIYGKSPTVQPPAVTAVPCIKAFGSVVNDLGVSLSDLVVRSTIIYPNGGSEGAPANVDADSRYEMDNPFPGFYVHCEVQLLIDGNWGDPRLLCFQNTSGAYFARGACASQIMPSGNVVLRTAKDHVIETNVNYVCSPFPSNTGTLASAPCRVIVTRLGKM